MQQPGAKHEMRGTYFKWGSGHHWPPNSPPWKKSFRYPYLRGGERALLTSRTVSKVSGTKDDHMFFIGFSSDTRASISNVKMVLKRLKLDQIAPISRWRGTKFFLHTRFAQLNHFTQLM